jgi:esterase/lipase superfamily enzyme
VSNEWEELVRLLGDDRDRIQYELTNLLRRLEEQGADTASVAKMILELFAQSPAAHRLLLQAIARESPQLIKGGTMPAGFVKKERFTSIPVFYGTDRTRMQKMGTPPSYGPDRGQLAFGFAEVSIPDDHRMGEVERPRWWKLQFRADPEKHVVVETVEELPVPDFESRAMVTLGSSAKKEVLLFVHGYNVAFEEAVSRTAQIAYDLQFEGLAALYSWPSEGSTSKYTVDETNVNWSRPHFAQFLAVLRERVGADVVHILAHSMGSRLVAETIASLSASSEPRGARLRQLVFAAPDIDAATFKDLAATFSRQAERVTLYSSSDDLALKASKLIHKYPRAGESGPDLVVLNMVDTVDATSIDTSLLGHSYYGDNRSVLSDLFELIRRGSAPHERFSLKPKERYGARYWLFSA